MSKSASVWNIIKKVFTWILVVVAVVVMIFTIVSVTTFDRNDRNVLGFKAFIVLSDSMSATDFDAGDVVVVNAKVDPTTLKPGDIIAYTSQNPENFGETVTHMIRTTAVSPEGDPGFITYGTTTNTDDETVVTYPYINGKYIFRLPKVGTFFFFLKTTPGYIVCILVPFLLLIGMQGVNCIQLFRRYKKEQMAEIEKEKTAVDAERQRSLDMMAELEALKLQLAQQKAGIAPAPAPQEEEYAEAVPVMDEPEAVEAAAPVAPVQRPATTRPVSQRPATAAQRPVTATQRPAGTAQRPAGTAPTQRPATATQRPAGAAQRPATATQRPAGTAPTRRPATATQRPAGTAPTQRPATATQRPAGAAPTQRPATATQRPATATQRPATATQRPAGAAQRPATATQRPAGTAQRPATASQRPAAATQRPAAAQPKPAADYSKMSVDDILAEFNLK